MYDSTSCNTLLLLDIRQVFCVCRTGCAHTAYAYSYSMNCHRKPKSTCQCRLRSGCIHQKITPLQDFDAENKVSVYLKKLHLRMIFAFKKVAAYTSKIYAIYSLEHMLVLTLEQTIHCHSSQERLSDCHENPEGVENINHELYLET